jgi:hypothetical protein
MVSLQQICKLLHLRDVRKSNQICGFAIFGTYLRTAHNWKLAQGLSFSEKF